ncbi:MAG: efflux RND transporter permease subunit, partial [Candidatus Hydrogenedentes bacterium]|nr:efflux RND transporter permease subunit [Candidatus Hydrogenedentota bacterium]
MGIDLAMFSVFGMVALTGVVVNDAIVLIEAVNRNLASGREVFDAIERGGARRFRAILLTTISTVGGLLPLIIETDAGAVRVTPMALSIASGVLFATLLTLIYVPCLLAILNDFRRLAHFGVRNRWPSREEVEPARLRNIDILAEEESAADGTSVGGPIAAK